MNMKKGKKLNMSDNSTPYRAADYDCDVIETIPFYHQLHTEAIDLVRTVRPDVTVWLDTGCGTGYLVEQALPVFPGTRFFLADPSAGMLERAGARLSGVPSERLCFLAPLRSEELAGAVGETPQVISAIQSHHYGGAEARRRATRVCHQLLEPGGIYVTFENFRPATLKGVEIALERWLCFQKTAGRSSEAVEEHRLRFDRNYFPITVAEHLELLRNTGFSTAEVFWLSQMQAGFYAIK
jgi:tRNA (cmo5U34)-methyltransferase